MPTGKKPKRGTTSRRIVRARELEVKALALRKAGASYQQIKDELGLKNKSTGNEAVKRVLKRFVKECYETAPEVLQLELQRLDTMFLGAYEKARRGDLAAIKSALGIMDRRAKYLGLDAKVNVEISGPNGGPIELAAGGYDVTKLDAAEREQLQKLIDKMKEPKEIEGEVVDARLEETRREIG